MLVGGPGLVLLYGGYRLPDTGIDLGLTFVQQLSETYGWTCTVEEGPDGGARFEFADVDVVSTEPRQLHETPRLSKAILGPRGRQAGAFSLQRGYGRP